MRYNIVIVNKNNSSLLGELGSDYLWGREAFCDQGGGFWYFYSKNIRKNFKHRAVHNACLARKFYENTLIPSCYLKHSDLPRGKSIITKNDQITQYMALF